VVLTRTTSAAFAAAAPQNSQFAAHAEIVLSPALKFTNSVELLGNNYHLEINMKIEMYEMQINCKPAIQLKLKLSSSN